VTVSGAQYDNPNQEAVRPDGSGPGEEGEGGSSGGEASAAAPEPTETKLPGTHAALDDLAAEQGHEWSRTDLTVAEKQAELGG
jgi:hypothetical protein